MGSDGDMGMDLAEWRSIIDDQKRLYVAKFKVWQERECTLLVKSIASILMQRGAVDSPSNRQKLLLEKCLRCLRVSEDLVAGLITNAESKVASAMASWAMSSELEMLDNKTSDSSKIRKSRDKHLKLYDVLKKEENKRIQKFLQVCDEETRAFVEKSVLRNLIRIFLRLDTAKYTTKDTSSSQSTIARIIQILKELVRKIDDKVHKDSLQGLPNSECSVCFSRFSLKRKRGCISPCGHASICFDCAEHVYKRTKTCPLCGCGMEKPVPLPGKLYF